MGIDNGEGSDDQKLEKKQQLMQDYGVKSARIHSMNQLLKAYTLFEKDIEYVVMETFTTLATDDRSVELLPGGAQRGTRGSVLLLCRSSGLRLPRTLRMVGGTPSASTSRACYRGTGDSPLPAPPRFPTPNACLDAALTFLYVVAVSTTDSVSFAPRMSCTRTSKVSST